MQDAPQFDVDFGVAVESLEENLEMEFKLEFDLTTPAGKAKLAKEIGALCNYGGGWIVFGRNDDGTYPASLPEKLKGVDQDTINQIASAYLVPAPHCTLRWVRPPATSFDVPVVRVPTVGVVPICGKKNGPNDDKGKTTGIQKGTYYIRAAGPISTPIDSPEQWSDLIRRCVLSDKTALLSALSVMVSQPTPRAEQKPSYLDQDIDFLSRLWLEKVAGAKHQVDLTKNFVTLGFEFLGEEDQPRVTTGDIKRVLSQRSTQHFGPRRFFEDGVSGTGRPYVIENAGVDGLQAEDVIHDGYLEDLPFIWRINEALCGVEIISFWEDTSWLKSAVEDKSSRKWEAGKNVWIAIQLEYIEGFLSSVRDLLARFGFQGKVRIRAIYRGLADRVLNSPRSSMSYSMRYIAHQDLKTIDLTFDLAALEDEVRSAAVAAIAQSVNKLFQGPEITAEGVVRILSSHRRSG